MDMPVLYATTNVLGPSLVCTYEASRFGAARALRTDISHVQLDKHYCMVTTRASLTI